MRQRAKALHDFQNDPPTTVFLLSMRAGAVGINLTQANRVFLLEPCFNPALELQAIGRVHRLGQKRNVEITRLVVKSSVESRMVQMLEAKYGSTGGEERANGAVAANTHSTTMKKASDVAVIGSLKSDKTDIVKEEFDFLFGIDGDNSESDAPSCFDDDDDDDGDNAFGKL